MAPKRKPRASRNSAPTHDTPEDEAPVKSAAQNGRSKPAEVSPNRQNLSTATSQTFDIPNSKPTAKPIHCLRQGLPEMSPDLVFTHGAGGDLSAPAIVNFAAGFTETSPLLCFEGSSNLVSCANAFNDVIESEKDTANRFTGSLGGRSLGAQAAVVAATELVKEQDTPKPLRLVLVSYPLIGPKGDVRDEILLALPEEVQVLFISGSKDGMCNFETLEGVRGNMKARSRLVVVSGADHGMNVSPKKMTAKVGEETGKVASEWLNWSLELQEELEILIDQESGEVVRRVRNTESASSVPNGKAQKESMVERAEESANQTTKPKNLSTKGTKVPEDRPPKDTKSGKKRKSAPKDPEKLGPSSLNSGNATLKSSKRKRSTRN